MQLAEVGHGRQSDFATAHLLVRRVYDRQRDGPAVLRPLQQEKLARGAKDEEHAMSPKLNAGIAVIGIDIGKNSFHVVGLDRRGAIVLRQKWSRGQVETRLVNLSCLIGMEACVGAHHLSRKLTSLCHDARLMPAYHQSDPPSCTPGCRL
jgi:hypothetical protein